MTKVNKILQNIKKKKSNNKWCKLPKNAKLFFGSGGSKCIIAIVGNRAYKYFPIIISESKLKSQIQTLKYEYKYEIKVIKDFTQKIVKTKLSPHIIKYYNNYKCNKKPNKIFKDCPSYTKMIMSKKKINNKCKLILQAHPKILYKLMYILEMEKADNSLENEIKQISNYFFKYFIL